jgi:hypothetical protein
MSTGESSLRFLKKIGDVKAVLDPDKTWTTTSVFLERQNMNEAASNFIWKTISISADRISGVEVMKVMAAPNRSVGQIARRCAGVFGPSQLIGERGPIQRAETLMTDLEWRPIPKKRLEDRVDDLSEFPMIRTDHRISDSVDQIRRTFGAEDHPIQIGCETLFRLWMEGVLFTRDPDHAEPDRRRREADKPPQLGSSADDETLLQKTVVRIVAPVTDVGPIEPGQDPFRGAYQVRVCPEMDEFDHAVTDVIVVTVDNTLPGPVRPQAYLDIQIVKCRTATRADEVIFNRLGKVRPDFRVDKIKIFHVSILR